MVFVETVLFLAAAVAAGFLIARFVLVKGPLDRSDPGGVRRSEAQNAAGERDRLRAELEEARRELGEARCERPTSEGSEARVAELERALDAARRRMEELERELGEARRRPQPKTAGEAGVGVPPPALAAPDGPADDLKRIAGIGPGIERTLNEIGIWHFRQIAGLDPENITWLDRRLPMRGRIERQAWVAQARALAAGASTDAARNGATAAAP